ncbi:MAG: hypothetical protein AABX14_01815 [Candidatus Aenigmatarchaeota archaeon]
MPDEITYAAKKGVKSVFEMVPVAAMMRFVELYDGSHEMWPTIFAANTLAIYYIFYRDTIKDIKSAVAAGGALSYTGVSLLIDWLYR